MRLRRLSEKGLQRFGEFLDSLTTDFPRHYPAELLSDDETSELISPCTEMDQHNFVTRLDAAKYLYEKLTGCELTGLETDKGLWAWLALFYFEHLCPRDKDGRYKPGERAHWIPAVDDARRYYRHLLAGPYRVFRANHDAPEQAMILLYGPLHTVGHFYYQLASRQQLVTNKSVLGLATEMYIDPTTREPKRGAQTYGRPGSIFRLVDVLNQLDTTWDLYAMTKDQIAAMLPHEFDQFWGDSHNLC